jgi:hypothetical protein
VHALDQIIGATFIVPISLSGCDAKPHSIGDRTSSAQKLAKAFDVYSFSWERQ